jgi:hypothetical protein
VLCKSAVSKHMAKLRLAEDRHHETTRRTPTFELTDVECFKIELQLVSAEDHVFEHRRGFGIKDAHQESGPANVNELHEPWANRGADLDVWEIRRADRARFGGVVLTSAWFELADEVKARIAADVPPDIARFHLKEFEFELKAKYKKYLSESANPYDRDLANAA